MQKRQYSKGERVFCDGLVCMIDDIRTLDFAVDPERLYYVLKPVSGGGSTMYMPADSEDTARRMRYILSRSQIDSLLADVRGRQLEWEEDRKVRTAYYHEILACADHEQLLLLIRCIYLRREQRALEGKRISAGDEAIMQSAQRLICEEFRHALGLSPEGTGEYIRQALGIE